MMGRMRRFRDKVKCKIRDTTNMPIYSGEHQRTTAKKIRKIGKFEYSTKKLEKIKRAF